MRKLELVGLDSDGRYLVFADEAGDEYVTPADERLRAALRGDRARLGQLEIDMDSALRPRDIQARIRAGESPDQVAVAAQVSVDKIMAYCVPVLAERRHVADLARRHHVRRKNAEGPARSLDAVVSDRLRGRGIDPVATEWDAWRRDDGRWSVRATYQSGEREHRADFVFDTIGRYALADDDEAKWLTGEQQSTRKGPQPREGGRSGERRLASVRTGDDLLSLSGSHGPGSTGRDHAAEDLTDDLLDDDLPDDDLPDDDELTDDLTAVVRAVREPAFEENLPDVEASPFPGEVEDDIIATAVSPADGADALPDAARPTPGQPEVEPVADRPRRSTRRAAVPSWDEIMLGKRKDEGS